MIYDRQRIIGTLRDYYYRDETTSAEKKDFHEAIQIILGSTIGKPPIATPKEASHDLANVAADLRGLHSSPED